MMDDNAIAVQRKLNNPYIFKTFRNRTITEQLLSPERMNGNLTEHDYQVVNEFFFTYRRVLLTRLTIRLQ